MMDEEKRAAEEKFWKQREENIAEWKNEEYDLSLYERAIAENITPVTIYLKIAEDAAELSQLAAMVARKKIGGPQIDIFDKSHENLRREYLVAQMNLAQCIRILYGVHDRYGRASDPDIYDLIDEVENSGLDLKRAKEWIEDIESGYDSYSKGRIYHFMYDWKKMIESTRKTKEESDGT